MESVKSIFARATEKLKSKKKLEGALNDENFLTIKNEKMKSGIELVVKIINSKVVRKTTKTAKEILDITEKIKTGNPISLTAAALASLETVATFFNIEKPNPLEEYISYKGLRETNRGRLIELILSPEVYENLDKKIVFVGDKVALQQITLGEGNFIYAKTTDVDDEGQPVFLMKYYVDENFSLPIAYEYIWSFFNGKAFLIREENSQGSQLRMRTLTLDNQDLLLDEKEIGLIGEEIRHSKEKGRSRSYLLVGPAGTGKSSTCFKAAERYCPKILRIDPTAMERMNVGELEEFVSGIRPDALIFDDIDRVDDDDNLLFLLENLKRSYPNLVIFASANYYDRISTALRRPGRFDRVLWVDNPKSEKRAEFITYFANKLNLKFSKSLFDYAVKNTKGLSQAYLSEMLYRATNDAVLETSIKGSIKESEEDEDDLSLGENDE